jgi:RNA polymerase sigma-70 factor (ECF subfamily)
MSSDPKGPKSSAPPARRGPSPPDRIALEAVRAREPAALATFFDRYAAHVYALVYRLLGAREEAEDVTQDVFFKVHRAAHRLDPDRDPLPWLTAIAYNACRDLWRSGTHRLGRRSDSLEDDTGLADRLAGPAGDPEAELIRSERERLVQDALLRLPDAMRAAIVLHDYEGLSHQEIAALTGIGHAAARKRYSRALAALARRLKETST